jgi:GT2 family glycosyltransferase
LEAQSVPVEVVVVEDVEGRGPAWARNEGVRRARGEVVCFTDDDCAPVAGWVEALAAPILAGGAEVATGPVRMGGRVTAADRAWEAIVHYLQVRAVAPGTASPGFVVTANLAVRRALLERLPFDPSFPAAAGEDRDWGERAVREGAETRFVQEAVVLHQSGMSVGTFLHQQYRYGQGAARYRKSDSGRKPGSAAFYLGLIQTGFHVGPAQGALICVAQVATAMGAISESAKTLVQHGFSRTR